MKEKTLTFGEWSADPKGIAGGTVVSDKWSKRWVKQSRVNEHTHSRHFQQSNHTAQKLQRALVAYLERGAFLCLILDSRIERCSCSQSYPSLAEIVTPLNGFWDSPSPHLELWARVLPWARESPWQPPPLGTGCTSVTAAGTAQSLSPRCPETRGKKPDFTS